MYKNHSDSYPVLNPAKLMAEVDPRLFDLYRKGAELHVWRNSSPHNWWLSEPGNAEAELYHFDANTRPGRAFFAFARQASRATDRVSYRGWLRGFDTGLPVTEAWSYDEDAYRACCNRWNNSVIRAAELNERAGTLAPNFSVLTVNELKLLRTLKRKKAIEVHPQDLDSIQTLCAMNFLNVLPDGSAIGTEQLYAGVIPSQATLRKIE